MKKINRILLLIILIVIVGLITVFAACEYSATDSGLQYTLNEDKSSYTVSGIGRGRGKVHVLETYNGLPVTKINAEAFLDADVLTEIIIPDSVTEIGAYAFYGCKNLVSVTLPTAINEISRGLFYDCISLVNVNIPSGVKYIGKNAFTN